MALNKEDQLQEAFRELHRNIQRKRYTIDTFESEYNKLCMRRENNVKHLEELHSKKYLLESFLKASECRVGEYERNEKEWEKETSELKNQMSSIKNEIKEEDKFAQLDDETFDVTARRLTEKMARDRDMYEKSNNKDELESVLQSQSSIEQEIADIEKMFRETEPFYWGPSQETAAVLNNSHLKNAVAEEITLLEKSKKNLEMKYKLLKDKATNLEQELDKLNIEM